MDDVMSDHEWSQSQVGTPSALSEIGTQIRKVISSGGFLKDDEGINIEKTNRILLSPFSQLPQLCSLERCNCDRKREPSHNSVELSRGRRKSHNYSRVNGLNTPCHEEGTINLSTTIKTEAVVTAPTKIFSCNNVPKFLTRTMKPATTTAGRA
eukprot:scaffold14940_cov200-Alexandrium_tamarense.AAC.1